MEINHEISEPYVLVTILTVPVGKPEQSGAGVGGGGGVGGALGSTISLDAEPDVPAQPPLFALATVLQISSLRYFVLNW